MNNILLTISIPTYNRAKYLALCLMELGKQFHETKGEIEILVSDNHSSDETQNLVENYISDGLAITYIRNSANIGSDRNIAQCFNKASGKYVLILGDDDVLLPGTLLMLLEKIKSDDFGIIFMAPYGYNIDYMKEKPPRFINSDIVYTDHDAFLIKLSNYLTFISANVINKSCISHLNTDNYIGTNLVQTYLIIEALLASDKNLYMRKYMVACKRNNSGGFDFISVFAGRLNEIFKKFTKRGLKNDTVRSINNKMLITYFPQHLIKMRSEGVDGKLLASEMIKYYRAYPMYWIFVHPMLRLPNIFSRIWGYSIFLISRALRGELLRILAYIYNATRKNYN